MKTPPLLLAYSIACLSIFSASAEVVIYDSNVDGLEVLTDGGLTAELTVDAPESDGNPTLVIGGDPNSPYSKFYSPGYKPTSRTTGTTLLPLPSAPDQEYSLTFETYIPTGGQIDKGSVTVKFYRDPERDYRVNDVSSQDGDSQQQVQQHNYKSILLGPYNQDRWQAVSVVGMVPTEDLGKHPIDSVRFSITFRQENPEHNTTPIEAYVRNIRLTTNADSETETP